MATATGMEPPSCLGNGNTEFADKMYLLLFLQCGIHPSIYVGVYGLILVITVPVVHIYTLKIKLPYNFLNEYTHKFPPLGFFD